MAASPQASPSGPPGGGPGGGSEAGGGHGRPSALSGSQTRASARVDTLKKRAEFLSVRQGSRYATANFVLEARCRTGSASAGASATPGGPRFGFTVSKKVGGAVDRNRIKRRLRAVVAQLQGAHARPDFDYVIIARKPALDAPFPQLLADFGTAMDRVVSKRPPKAKPASGRKPAR